MWEINTGHNSGIADEIFGIHEIVNQKCGNYSNNVSRKCSENHVPWEKRVRDRQPHVFGNPIFCGNWPLWSATIDYGIVKP